MLRSYNIIMEEHFSKPEFNDFPVSLHLGMIKDSVRMELFSRAIKSQVSNNDLVIDIGSGTGILSFFASEAGAAKVLGIELSCLAEYASEVKKINLPHAEIEFVQSDVLDLKPLDKKFDVAICELFGSFGIDESVIPIINHVRDNLLIEEGKLLPETLELFVAPVQCTQVYRDLANWEPKQCGLDFSPIQELAYNAVYHLSGDALDFLSEPQQLIDIDFYTIKNLPKSMTAEFEFDRDSVVHGIAGWFRSRLAPGIVLDTSPKQENTHWGQLFFPIGDPLRVQKGGTMEFVFREHHKEKLCYWNWSGKIKPKPGNSKVHEFSFNAIRDFGR